MKFKESRRNENIDCCFASFNNHYHPFSINCDTLYDILISFLLSTRTEPMKRLDIQQVVFPESIERYSIPLCRRHIFVKMGQSVIRILSFVLIAESLSGGPEEDNYMYLFQFDYLK